MAENSKIEWTDHTFNPWRGCATVHEGCANCYAWRDSKRFPAIRGVWGPNGTRVVASEASWRDPLKWSQMAQNGVCLACRGKGFTLELRAVITDTTTETVKDKILCGDCKATGRVAPYRARVFCASLADVFEDWRGLMHDHKGNPLYSLTQPTGEISFTARTTPDPARMETCRRRLFRLIDNTPWLDWQLVTKRPENVRNFWFDRYTQIPPSPKRVETKQEFEDEFRRQVYFRPNVWLLTSVSTQKSADVQIPELLKCRDLVPVLGLSAEPLLGPIDLTDYLTDPPGFALKWISRYYRTKDGKDCAFNEAGDGKEIKRVVKNPLPLDWIIVGGESGPGARPMHPLWAKMLRDQCIAAGIPFFFKQWGEHAPLGNVSGLDPDHHYPGREKMVSVPSGVPMDEPKAMFKIGKHNAGRVLDGNLYDEFPNGN